MYTTGISGDGQRMRGSFLITVYYSDSEQLKPNFSNKTNHRAMKKPRKKQVVLERCQNCQLIRHKQMEAPVEFLKKYCAIGSA